MRNDSSPCTKSAESSCARVCRNGVDDGARRRDAHRRSLESSPRVCRAIRLERSCPRTTAGGSLHLNRKSSEARTQVDRESMLRKILHVVATISRDHTRDLSILTLVKTRSSERVSREYIMRRASAKGSSEWKTDRPGSDTREHRARKCPGGSCSSRVSEWFNFDKVNPLWILTFPSDSIRPTATYRQGRSRARSLNADYGLGRSNRLECRAAILRQRSGRYSTGIDAESLENARG